MSKQNNELNSSQTAGTENLPVRYSLSLVYALSLIVALLMALASIAGILFPDALYPTVELQLSYIPSDAFNLAVGLPVLLVSMWLARRGKLIGLLCWPGALFYALYMYIPYVIGAPFNLLFLPYLILVALSASTLIGLVAGIDGEPIRQKLDDFVPARVGAGILLGLAFFIIMRQTALIVASLASHAPAGSLEVPSWIADFAVAIPALLAVGVQLWRRRLFGYVTGAGMFLGYGVLALSVVPFFVADARHASVPIDVGGLVMILAMVVLCLIPFGFFMRGAIKNN